MKEAIIQYNDDPDDDGNHMVISWKELVRCKDCKRYYANGGNCDQVLADWFCADGERK